MFVACQNYRDEIHSPIVFQDLCIDSIKFKLNSKPCSLHTPSYMQYFFLSSQQSLRFSVLFSQSHSNVESRNTEGEFEGEVEYFSAKCLDRRNRADLIDSATPCHDAQVVGSHWLLNPLLLTVLTAKSEDYTIAPKHLHITFSEHWLILSHQIFM